MSCERYFGFGCEIDEETSNKLEGTLFVSLLKPCVVIASLCYTVFFFLENFELHRLIVA